MIVQYEVEIISKSLEFEVCSLIPLQEILERSKYEFRLASADDNIRLTERIPILGRDEKAGRHTRTRKSSEQLQFTKIIEYPFTPPFFSAMSNEQQLPFSTANHPVLLSPKHANMLHFHL